MHPLQTLQHYISWLGAQVRPGGFRLKVIMLIVAGQLSREDYYTIVAHVHDTTPSTPQVWANTRWCAHLLTNLLWLLSLHLHKITKRSTRTR